MCEISNETGIGSNHVPVTSEPWQRWSPSSEYPLGVWNSLNRTIKNSNPFKSIMIINLINYFWRKAPLKSWRTQKNYKNWLSEIHLRVSVFWPVFRGFMRANYRLLYFKLDPYLTSPEILRLLAAASKSSIGSEIEKGLLRVCSDQSLT